jgi:hypothetical protein
MKPRYLLTLLFCILWCSCKSSDPASSAGSGGDIIPGDFRGAVVLYDSVGQAVQDKSGVRVELKGTQYSTMTDTGGFWVFHDLPTRVYSLTFSKSSFITRTDQFTYVGGGTLWYEPQQGYMALRQPPVFQFVFDAVVAPDSVEGKFYFHTTGMPPTNNAYGAVLAASTSPIPTMDDPSIRVLTNHNRNSFAEEGTATSFSLRNDVMSALEYYYGHHATVYFRLFPYLGYSVDYDIDPANQQLHYVNCGTGSNVLSIVVP